MSDAHRKQSARLMVISVVAALALGGGCSSSDDSVDTQGWSSRGVVENFAEGNIPADYIGPLSTYDPDSKGLSYTYDASAFKAFVPPGRGQLMYDGQVFVVDDLSDLRDLESYFTDDYGHGPTWVFTNENCGVLVEIDSSMPEDWAHEYEGFLQLLAGCA